MRTKQELRDMTCCFTGHRDISEQDRRRITAKLEKTVTELIQQGYLYFGEGGARGFDALAAQTILNLRARYPGIKLILVLPCHNQTKKWNTKDKEEHEYLKTLANKVVYTSQEYAPDCMHKRNRHLVDNSSVCVCYLNKDGGGTDYTVGYARLKVLKVINLAVQP